MRHVFYILYRVFTYCAKTQHGGNCIYIHVYSHVGKVCINHCLLTIPTTCVSLQRSLKFIHSPISVFSIGFSTLTIFNYPSLHAIYWPIAYNNIYKCLCIHIYIYVSSSLLRKSTPQTRSRVESPLPS